MKYLIKTLLLMVAFTGLLEAQNLKGEILKNSLKVQDISLTVTVDSAEELESTFKIEDFKSLIEESHSGETLKFKIICNRQLLPNGKKTHMSYEVSGNSDEQEEFIKNIEKIMESAKIYYTKQ